ncbi:MAG: DUF1616 domain-containing protein [Chloroflexales bacterium]|nr:DUF1616 domain-containing protein [Chloroflexales bacterium]
MTNLKHSYDLFVLAALAIAIPMLPALPAPEVRVPIGLLVALLAPGYALIAALFPRPADIDGLTRAALSCGTSLALLPLLITVLDQLPWKIAPQPILIALTILILTCCVVALFRRWQLVTTKDVIIPPAFDIQDWWRRLSESDQLMYAFGTLIIAVTINVSAALWLLPNIPAKPTEFYILDPSGLADNYPRAAIVGEPVTVTMGIRQGDSDNHNYRIEGWVSDPWNANRREQVLSESIDLMTDLSQEQTLTWRMPWAGDNQQVEILLLREDDTDPYRRLVLWINVEERR